MILLNELKLFTWTRYLFSRKCEAYAHNNKFICHCFCIQKYRHLITRDSMIVTLGIWAKFVFQSQKILEEKKNSHHSHYKHRLLLLRSEEMCWWTLYDTAKAIQDSTKSILLHRSCFQNLTILPVDVYWLFSCILWVFEQSSIIPFEEQIHGEMNLQILISRKGKVCNLWPPEAS